MSERLFQCKNCGARVLQSVFPGAEPVSCPRCKSHNWVEIRGFSGGSRSADLVDSAWVDGFLSRLQEKGNKLQW